MIFGAGYEGSPDLLNSGVGNLEIIPIKEGTGKPYSFYKFEFVAETSPVVIIVNGKRIYRKNGYWSTETGDSPVHSFIVVNEDVNFSWAGAYK